MAAPQVNNINESKAKTGYMARTSLSASCTGTATNGRGQRRISGKTRESDAQEGDRTREGSDSRRGSIRHGFTLQGTGPTVNAHSWPLS